eukprot:scaffold21565_cov54-Cyclotella_meneghiniana.AAC.3
MLSYFDLTVLSATDNYELLMPVRQKHWWAPLTATPEAGLQQILQSRLEEGIDVTNNIVIPCLFDRYSSD